MSKAPAHTLRRRPGFFRPVPLRSRRDGWSEARQCAFLAQLYVTGSVSAAARSVGMSRASAYRLRERAGAQSFAHAWDRIMTLPRWEQPATCREDLRKVTTATLIDRIERDLVQPVIFFGEVKGVRKKPDNSALLRLLGRTERWAADRFGEGSAG